jgi:hypothetical protein
MDFAMPTDRTRLLIIRAWTEEGSEEPLRAEVRVVTDLAAGTERTRTFARPEEVVATVRGWLADIVKDEPLPHAAPGS